MLTSQPPPPFLVCPVEPGTWCLVASISRDVAQLMRAVAMLPSSTSNHDGPSSSLVMGLLSACHRVATTDTACNAQVRQAATQERGGGHALDTTTTTTGRARGVAAAAASSSLLP